MTDDLERRIEVLEIAVLALGVEEFGDSPGHPFRGNQHTGSSGFEDILGTKPAGPRGLGIANGDPGASSFIEKKSGDSFGPNLRPGLPDKGSTNGTTAMDARNMDRAQKLINYEKMHGTAAMLKQMTPAERDAHSAHRDFQQGPGYTRAARVGGDVTRSEAVKAAVEKGYG